MEHRLGHRVAIREHVQLLTSSGGFREGVLTDISLSGAFVSTRLRLPPLASLYVSFPNPRDVSRSQVVKAQVVRESGDGFGIEWWQFAPPTAMRRLCEPRLRDAAESSKVGETAERRAAILPPSSNMASATGDGIAGSGPNRS